MSEFEQALVSALERVARQTWNTQYELGEIKRILREIAVKMH
jgi:hypothetical protein